MAKGNKTGGRCAGTPNKATVDVKALAQDYGTRSIAPLAKIMEDGKEPAAARASAARELLNRGYGKVSQRQRRT